MKNEDLYIYCIGSIPVDSASIYFYDFLSNKKKVLSVKEREIVNSLKKKKEISKTKKTDFLNIVSFADGAYPCYVAIDVNKKVKKLFFEINNSCGWGSNMFHPEIRKTRIESERVQKPILAAAGNLDMQLDMPVSARISINFESRHRKTYTPWNWFKNINEPLFSKQKNTIRKKLCDLNIKSKFIVFDDFGEIDNKKKEYDKISKLKKFYPDEKIYFPVKNKSYPVYIHHIFKNDKELKSDLDNENLQYEISNPIYPIICIENIEDCYLSKDKDCKLFFSRKNTTNKISENLLNQIKNKPKELKICQLDSDNISTLKFLDKLKWNIDLLELWNFNQISDWTNMKKLVHVKCIKFMNCDLKIDDIGPKTWGYVMSTIQKVRKENSSINAVYGNLKINVNGKDIDLTTLGK